jgi:hypothetical protein
MDLLKELAKKINITYELFLSPDGQFGSYIIRNSTGKYSSIYYKYSISIIQTLQNILIMKCQCLNANAEHRISIVPK